MSYSSTILGTAGLVSYWKLGETSGTVAADSKGSNPGTYTGGYTLNQAGGAAGLGPAVLFNGTSGYVTIPTAASLEITGDSLIEAWVKLTSAPRVNGATTIAGKSYSASSQPYVNYMLGGEDDLGKWGAYVGPNTSFYKQLGTATPTAGTWYYLVASRSDSVKQLALWENAIQVGTSVTTGTVLNSGQPFVIGASHPGSYAGYFPGTIQHVAVYNTVLDGATQAAHYAAASAVDPIMPNLQVAQLQPSAGVPLNSGYPARPVATNLGEGLGFSTPSSAHAQSVYWLFWVPQGTTLATGLTASLILVDDLNNASPGGLATFAVSYALVTSGTTVFTDAAFTGTEDSGQVTMPAVAGALKTLTIAAVAAHFAGTIAANTWVVVRVQRKAGATDTHGGRIILLGVNIIDT